MVANLGGVLEEAIVRGEHLVGEEEEVLARQATVVKPGLADKLHPEPLLQLLRTQLPHLRMAVRVQKVYQGGCPVM